MFFAYKVLQAALTSFRTEWHGMLCEKHAVTPAQTMKKSFFILVS